MDRVSEPYGYCGYVGELEEALFGVPAARPRLGRRTSRAANEIEALR
jgi:hypothetical protein